MRGGLRGESGVVAASSSNATMVAGVTPTAAGLAILGGADAAAQRISLGLGTIATQAANSVSISGGSITGITDLAVAEGGTGASTDIAARTNLGGSLGRVPLVHAATTAPTVNDDSADGYSAGDLWNDTTNNRTYIADSVGVGAADWRSLLSPNAVYAYFSGGVAYAQAANIAPDGTITPVGAAVAATAADPSSYLIVGSGADINYPTVIVGAGTNVGTLATRWTWVLSDLGITLPSGALQTTCNVSVTSFTEGLRPGATSYLLWGLGTGATAPTSLVGVARTTSGAAWNSGYLTSTAGGNAAGASGDTRFSGVRVVGDSTNTDYAIWRYSGSDMTGSSQALGGPSVTTTPTHVGIWAMVNSGTTTGLWTITAPVFTLRWNVL